MIQIKVTNSKSLFNELDDKVLGLAELVTPEMKIHYSNAIYGIIKKYNLVINDYMNNQKMILYTFLENNNPLQNLSELQIKINIFFFCFFI